MPDYKLKKKDYSAPDQIIIPRVGPKGVYFEPVDHYIDHKGRIVFKRVDDWGRVVY